MRLTKDAAAMSAIEYAQIASLSCSSGRPSWIGSVVPCFAGPGQGRARVGDRLTAVSSIPDGFAAYVNTGIGRRAMIKKIRRHV
jgi:hypothetical protein